MAITTITKDSIVNDTTLANFARIINNFWPIGSTETHIKMTINAW